MAVKKPTTWLAVLIISIFVFIISLSIHANQIQKSSIKDELVTTSSTKTTISSVVAYLSYLIFIVSGIMVSYNLKQTKNI